ncbi:MAG: GNAT family N-acetyltransferase [Ketobacter sp.]|nr:GNAT family N-acetyltransferase [Ketobacter sp.]
MNDLMAFLAEAKQRQKQQQMTHQPFNLPPPVQALSNYIHRVKSGQVASDGLAKYGKMLAPQSAQSIMDNGVAPYKPESKEFNELMGDFIPGGGLLGTIGGKAAKTADLVALQRAQELQQAGKSADDIYADTKWWLDHPDGQPRFEIDDSGAALHGLSLTRKANPIKHQMDDLTWKQERSAVPFDELVTHSELTNSYPDIRALEYGAAAKGNTQGTYRADIGNGYIGLNPHLSIKDANSTNLHELQHAVQGREGFARGGSPEIFIQKKVQAEARANFLNKELSEAAHKLDDVPKGSPEHKYWKEQYDAAMSEKMGLVDDWMSDPYQRYKSLAGETEARLVQDRMNMTMPDRHANPFYKNYDVPLDQQIVRKDGLLQQSVAPKGLLGDGKGAENVKELSEKIKDKYGIDFHAYERGDNITLNMIEVPKGNRKQGIGSDAINDLVEYADASGKRIKLTPGLKDDRHGTTSRNRLVKFYKRFGFVENKGRNKDFTISEGMFRDPSK